MASSGKKNKKSKGKTVPLNDFLQESSAGTPFQVKKVSTNWADEVEDSYDSYESNRATNIVLPTAPKSARGIDDFSDKIPQNPPFLAYLSNLPYDVEDVEIEEFFQNLKISNMRIPREDRSGESSRVKGFGYVEFEDQKSLIEALSMPSCTLKGRRIRVEVATNSENDRRRGGRMDLNRDRPERTDTMGDWRSSGGRSDMDSDRDRRGGGGGGGGGGFTRERSDRVESDKPGAWRDATDRPAFRDERPSFRDNDRYKDDKAITRGGGGGFDRDGDRRGGFDKDGDRRGGFDRGGDRRGFDRDGDRRGVGFDRDGDRRGGGFERDGDRRGGFDRDGGRGSFGPRRDDRNGGREEDGAKDGGEARARPKLNLAKRTVAPTDTETDGNKPTAPVTSASIFGNAKPVDTSARERQIEERLAKQNLDLDSKRDDKKRDEPRGRRYSPDRSRRRSPNRSSERRSSPIRRGSPDKKDYSPERRYSPRRSSPDIRRDSPNRAGDSPIRRNHSPDQRENSSERRNDSPERRPASPNQESPERKAYSPERERVSPDGSASPEKREIKKDDGRGPNDRNEKGTTKEKKSYREYTEKDMPKLKTPEPINIVATNQYSFLDNDESE